MPQTSIGRLRVVAIVEAISFLLLLFVAMPLKYLAGQPLAVRIVGMAHGLWFIAFVLMLMQAHTEHEWPTTKSLKIFVASLVPFGPFFLDRGLREEDAATGG